MRIRSFARLLFERNAGAISVFNGERFKSDSWQNKTIGSLLVASGCTRADDANGAVAANKIAQDIPSWNGRSFVGVSINLRSILESR